VPKPGYQSIRIPKTGKYRITIQAPGVKTIINSSYGMGFSAKFDLKAGFNLIVILGQIGNNPMCGSGGTFVIFQRKNKSELLMAAGGAASCATTTGRRKECTKFDGKTPLRAVRRQSQPRVILKEPKSAEKIYSGGSGFRVDDDPDFDFEVIEEFLPGSFADGFIGGRGYYVNSEGDREVKEGGFGGGGAGFQTDRFLF